MVHDLVIQGGTLIDPLYGIHGACDIAVAAGRISAIDHSIPASAARSALDATGLLVVPGLIDLHAHVAETIISLGVAPDRAGVHAGITAVCDAGSLGYTTFPAFRRFVLPAARSDVFCFLHLSPVGEIVLPEIGYQAIDRSELLAAIEQNRDVIKGIKLRAVANVMGRRSFDVVQIARDIADAAGLPIMVHLGIGMDEQAPSDDEVAAFTRRLLASLRAGDILTHVYTPKPGGVISHDGAVLPEFHAAVARGVLLDVGASKGHLSFAVARAGLALGVTPTTLSTDLTVLTAAEPQFASLPVLMSKFLALGLTLDQVVAMATIHPARALGESHRRGCLGMGMPADATLLELRAGEFLFSDGRAGNTVAGRQLLIPRLTLKDGLQIDVNPDFATLA